MASRITSLSIWSIRLCILYSWGELKNMSFAKYDLIEEPNTKYKNNSTASGTNTLNNRVCNENCNSEVGSSNGSPSIIFGFGNSFHITYILTTKHNKKNTRYYLLMNTTLTPSEQFELQKLLGKSDAEDNTLLIRQEQHSELLLNDIRTIEQLKRSETLLRQTDVEEFKILCQTKAHFMYSRFTSLFNKLVDDELNLVILIKMIQVLKMIEHGDVDQHEGSVIVGKYLKELFVDSAIRRGEKIDEQYAAEKEPMNTGKTISWKEYKASQM